MMRLKIALLCALLVPLGTAKAGVTTFSNSTTGSSTAGDSSLFIRFVIPTSTGSAFSLGSIQIRGTGVANTSNITARLFSDATTTVGAQVNAAYTSGGTFDLSGIGSFGDNTTLWLRITGLDIGKYYVGDATALTKSDSGSEAATNADLVTALGGSTAPAAGNIFSIQSFTVSVPEPATMILTGSALAAGAIGAYFKRRRKPQTEIAA